MIELGAWAEVGLTYAQGEQAKQSLIESIKIVLGDGYVPPSPIRDLAANRSLDELAPDNPVAAELAQMRVILDELRARMVPRPAVPIAVREDIRVLRETLENNVQALVDYEIDALATDKTSAGQDQWVAKLRDKWLAGQRPADDPWTSPPSVSTFSDEPPF